MKIVIGMALLLGLGSAGSFAEPACEPAVDVAESLNVNARSDCNYEKTGLNRVVHQMFKGKSAQDDSKSSLPADDSGVYREASSEKLVVQNARELSEARFQLLLRLGQNCPGGFDLTKEQYLPAGKGLELKLMYECIQALPDSVADDQE